MRTPTHKKALQWPQVYCAFMHFHLPAVRLYKRIVKVLRDNVGSTNLRVDVLLRTIRDLLKVDKLRYISGWPRTHRPRDDNPRQMELPLF